MDNQSLVIDKINKIFINRKKANLRKLAREIESVVIENGYWSKDLFEALLELFNQSDFYSDEDGAELLVVIENQWDDFNEEQKNRILDNVDKSFPKYTNWKSLFILSEILGEYYNNEEAYKILFKYKKIEDELHRCFIPHGFEHIIKNKINKELSLSATKELLSMKNDKSNMVRNEVFQALHNLDIKMD